jgi:hypothetical protein
MSKILIILALATVQIGANVALQPLFDASVIRGHVSCGTNCD